MHHWLVSTLTGRCSAAWRRTLSRSDLRSSSTGVEVTAEAGLTLDSWGGSHPRVSALYVIGSRPSVEACRVQTSWSGGDSVTDRDSEPK